MELLWDTPGDPDQTDVGPEAGSDLDLHFVNADEAHGDANGDGIIDGLFDAQWDTFWFNHSPNWGRVNPSVPDDPSLDLDDTDGTGPENLNLMIPGVGTTYDIFVHYWSDHGFGPSTATVRVYLNGQLAFEAHQALVNHDMWPVARIVWGVGVVAPLGTCSYLGPLCAADAMCPSGTCDAVVWPEYTSPYFPPGD